MRALLEVVRVNVFYFLVGRKNSSLLNECDEFLAEFERLHEELVLVFLEVFKANAHFLELQELALDIFAFRAFHLVCNFNLN